jgi:DNA-binding transcriptional ArsR family regulator
MYDVAEQSSSSMDERVSVEVLHAIAHPLRLGSLVALEERQRTAEELATVLRVPAQELIEHLAELAAAGLIGDGDGGEGRLRPLARGWADVAARLRRLQGGTR